MKIFKCFLMVVCVGVLSAWRSPTASISDTKVSLACLEVKPTTLPYQPGGGGSFSKGPAINILNKCNNDITVTEILATLDLKQPKAPVTQIDVWIVSPKPEQNTAEAGRTFWVEDGGKCSRAAMSPRCNSVTLQPEEAIEIGMPARNYFSIIGYLEIVSPYAKFQIDGKMQEPK